MPLSASFELLCYIVCEQERVPNRAKLRCNYWCCKADMSMKYLPYLTLYLELTLGFILPLAVASDAAIKLANQLPHTLLTQLALASS